MHLQRIVRHSCSKAYLTVGNFVQDRNRILSESKTGNIQLHQFDIYDKVTY